jgi:hypothetical protein
MFRIILAMQMVFLPWAQAQRAKDVPVELLPVQRIIPLTSYEEMKAYFYSQTPEARKRFLQNYAFTRKKSEAVAKAASRDSSARTNAEKALIADLEREAIPAYWKQQAQARNGQSRVDPELCAAFTRMYDYFDKSDPAEDSQKYQLLAAGGATVFALASASLLQIQKKKVKDGVTEVLTRGLRGVFRPDLYGETGYGIERTVVGRIETRFGEGLAHYQLAEEVTWRGRDANVIKSQYSHLMDGLPAQAQQQFEQVINAVVGDKRFVENLTVEAFKEAGLDPKMSMDDLYAALSKTAPGIDEAPSSDVYRAIWKSEMAPKFRQAFEAIDRRLVTEIVHRLMTVPGPVKESLNVVMRSLGHVALKNAGILAKAEGQVLEKKALARAAEMSKVSVKIAKEGAEKIAATVSSQVLKRGVWTGLGAASALVAGFGFGVLAVPLESAALVAGGSVGTVSGDSLTEMYENNPSLFFNGDWTPAQFCIEERVMSLKTRNSLMELDKALSAGGFYGGARASGTDGAKAR